MWVGTSVPRSSIGAASATLPGVGTGDHDGAPDSTQPSAAAATPPRPWSSKSSLGENVARSKIASALFGAPAPKIGRYTILGALGRGGMGAVYAAYDDKLDRRIAIKLLHHSGPDASARLLGEARALARVEHPNVVAVHDVGEDGDRVYVAMEFVRGRDLRQWLTQSHTWREIVEVFVQAGRGLAAAHAVSVLHRDFKPDNVLISDETRVRVADFGLALVDAAAGTPTITLEDDGSRDGGPVDHAAGTPPYMAPEQLRGEPLDHRADQFAFCVSLFEALYGTRPFWGNTLAEFAEAIRAGAPRVDAERDVPRWVRPIVVRGLAADREQRWSSMDALVDALSAPLRRRRGRIAWGVVAAATGLGAIALATRGANEFVCDGGTALVESAFSDERRQQAADAFAAAADGWGQDAWRRVDAELSAYAGAWSDRHRYFCEATHLRRELSAEHLDTRMRCLERRWRVFSTLMDLFTRADAALVERSSAALESLRSPDTCPDDDATAKVPAELADAVNAVDLKLQESTALQAAGRYDDSKQIVLSALQEADALGFAPLRARAAGRLGTVSSALQESEPAREYLRQAYLSAHELGMTGLMVDTAHELAFVSGNLERDLSEALVWSDLEAASLRRLADTATPGQWANHRRTRATVYESAGKLDEAIVAMREALEAETAAQIEPLGLATTLNNFAVTMYRAGRHDESLTAVRRAVEIRRSVQGPDHPMTLQTTNLLAVALTEAGEHQQSIEVATELLDRVRRVRGTADSLYATVLGNRANTLAKLDRLDDALADYDAAIRTFEPDSLRQGPVLVSRAGVLRRLDRHAEAKQSLQRALEVFEAQLPPGHESIAVVLSNLANVSSDLGDHEDAIALSQRALEILESGAKASAQRARVEANLASSLVAVGRDDEALALTDAALARLSAESEPDPTRIGWMRAKRGAVLLSLKRTDDAIDALASGLAELERGRAVPHQLAQACEWLAHATAAAGAPAEDVAGWVRRARTHFGEEVGYEDASDALQSWFQTWLKAQAGRR